ncbi:toxin co-regulated pilus biosynthesis Q family protein [Yokenella regensburgei]|uniref:toxin co-regulated pilus biosynthesis Q family protein n=1 Tax=Yokenella regensburgei TaxID=158877 RepID=UPI003ED86B0E
MENKNKAKIKFVIFLIYILCPLHLYATEIGAVLQGLSVKKTTGFFLNNKKKTNLNKNVKEINANKININVSHGLNYSIDHWDIKKGMTLNQILYLWTKKAGWNLAWEANQDYMITSDAVIHGDFNDAIKNLFKYTGQMNPPIFISLYDKNKVLRVSSEN